MIGGDLLQGFLAIAGGVRLEAQPAEHGGGHALVHGIVLHHQGVVGAVDGFPWRWAGGVGLAGGVCQLKGQLEPERGTFAEVGVNLNVAAHQFHQALHQGQAQPGTSVQPGVSAIKLFKGIKNVVQALHRNAGPGVAD